MPRVPSCLDPTFSSSCCFTFLLPFTEKISQKRCLHSLSPFLLLQFSPDYTPVSFLCPFSPCPSSNFVPVMVINDIHIVKVIVQVSVLIQLDPSIALDTADDSLFLETLCSLGFQDTHNPGFPLTQRKPIGHSSVLLLVPPQLADPKIWVGPQGDLGPLASVSFHLLENHIQSYGYRYHIWANASQTHTSSLMTSHLSSRQHGCSDI